MTLCSWQKENALQKEAKHAKEARETAMSTAIGVREEPHFLIPVNGEERALIRILNVVTLFQPREPVWVNISLNGRPVNVLVDANGQTREWSWLPWQTTIIAKRSSHAGWGWHLDCNNLRLDSLTSSSCSQDCTWCLLDETYRNLE
eukprot:762980-Hanusia_phi.AAC.2